MINKGNPVNISLEQFREVAQTQRDAQLTINKTTGQVTVKTQTWQGVLVAFLRHIPLLHQLIPPDAEDMVTQAAFLQALSNRYTQGAHPISLDALSLQTANPCPLTGHQVIKWIQQADQLETIAATDQLTDRYPENVNTNPFEIMSAIDSYKAETQKAGGSTILPTEEQYVALQLYARLDLATKNQMDTLLQTDAANIPTPWQHFIGDIKGGLEHMNVSTTLETTIREAQLQERYPAQLTPNPFDLYAALEAYKIMPKASRDGEQPLTEREYVAQQLYRQADIATIKQITAFLHTKEEDIPAAWKNYISDLKSGFATEKYNLNNTALRHAALEDKLVTSKYYPPEFSNNRNPFNIVSALQEYERALSATNEKSTFPTEQEYVALKLYNYTSPDIRQQMDRLLDSGDISRTKGGASDPEGGGRTIRRMHYLVDLKSGLTKLKSLVDAGQVLPAELQLPDSLIAYLKTGKTGTV